MMPRSVATPMPLSAPSVVPFAVTQSPETTGTIGSRVKSCRLAGMRSPTMSRCACKTVTGSSSRPAVAGILTRRFPVWSDRTSKPRRLASDFRYSRRGPSCLERRGNALMSQNACQISPAGPDRRGSGQVVWEVATAFAPQGQTIASNATTRIMKSFLNCAGLFIRLSEEEVFPHGTIDRRSRGMG
ncbi:MAG: hypothetical protein BWY66_01927 [bacterium ADurb.Bin374]|nr:MAG: hypothetical protein BWY66_01927 [bacterium ADurb.Bin374]